MNDKPTDPNDFHAKLEKYPIDPKNVLFVIYGMIRRVIWIITFFRRYISK